MGKIVTDTTDFFSINYGDIIRIQDRKFRVTGHAREMRFGIEDPKFWVKKAVDLKTGRRKYIKLAFHEEFDIKLGGVNIKCFRNPEKEGGVLNLVKDHPNFMQGDVYHDEKGNNIRVLDIVSGVNFLFYIDALKMTYDEYFKKHMPFILRELIKLFEAIQYLHSNGFTHGDIRNDHVIKETKSGNLVWIDFDYDYETGDNPFSLDIFGIGNILNYTIGKGFHTYYHIKNNKHIYEGLEERVFFEDFSLLDQRRLINLRKLYPQIPDTLNNLLLHFSNGAEIMYESVEEIIEDMHRCLQAFHML